MEITKQQIEAWKKKHGDVFKITVEDKTGYFKTPNRKTLGFASMAAKDNPLKFNEVLMNDCWLDGDEELKTNDMLFLSVSAKLADLIQVKTAELEKL